jgi:cytochrome o ubiquinol oxidase subunit III
VSSTSAFAPSNEFGERAQKHKSGDPHRLGHGGDGGDRSVGHGSGGPASKRIVVGYGFWMFILSDFVMFAAFFAAYAVLKDATNGGPSGAELFNRRDVAIETACLLMSSFTCGMASIAQLGRRPIWFQLMMVCTGILGLSFLGLEAKEFLHMIQEGNGPSRSAFLSAFFTLVGCHGLHVTVGGLWLLTMMAQVLTKGFREDIMRRVMCFTLFWHALDIVWVGVFTVVYLVGLSI